jgi:hypothetical protein
MYLECKRSKLEFDRVEIKLERVFYSRRRTRCRLRCLDDVSGSIEADMLSVRLSSGLDSGSGIPLVIGTWTSATIYTIGDARSKSRPRCKRRQVILPLTSLSHIPIISRNSQSRSKRVAKRRGTNYLDRGRSKSPKTCRASWFDRETGQLIGARYLEKRARGLSRARLSGSGRARRRRHTGCEGGRGREWVNVCVVAHIR